MPTQTELRKVTDYDRGAVEEKLVAALRRRQEATVADLVADTALPKLQVEEGMRLVLHEYVGHLKATESGELLYSFPSGMRNQVKGFWPTLRRGLRAAGRVASRVGSVLFKVWIAGMLVGYFAVFVALFLLAIVASIAGSMASRGQGERDNRSRGPGIGGFYLVSRMIDLMFVRILLNSGSRPDKKEKGRPLHRSVFAYVFGEKDADPEWEDHERKAVLRFLRTRKGVVSLEEIVRLTGRSREDAERLATSLLVEYEGEPVVTERGTILYSFPELLRTRTEALAAEGGTVSLRARPLIRFSDNKPKTNRWITFFNVFNLVFGSYFLGYSASVVAGTFSPSGPASAFYQFVAVLIQRYLGVDYLPLLGIGLGVVPVAFAVVFFAVPLIRKLRLERRNEEIRERNVRRDLYGALMARPRSVVPEELAGELAASSESRTRLVPRDLPGLVKREIDELAAAKQASVEQGASGSHRYSFDELAAEIEDADAYRLSVDTSRLDVGKTVFDSAE
jgi:hypothetical protein